MLPYLISKARKAGFSAYIKNNSVTIVLPISFFGKDKSVLLVQVSTIAEYRALMGDD